MSKITPAILQFLEELKKKNSREWMDAHKKQYLDNEKLLKEIYEDLRLGISEEDEIEKVKIFRIHRDVRFSKNKIPYNVHRSVSYSRAGAHRRGGYYLRIEPNGNSRVSGGFFSPEAADLKRIRREFEMDATEIRAILNATDFKVVYGNTFDPIRAVQTAPRGFNKEDPNIDLIRLKSFFVTKSYTDSEVLAVDFKEKVIANFKLLRPFFDYMSDVLTTDLNGESVIGDSP